MASSTGAALCRAPIWSASAEALLTRPSSLWRSPGWNKHALTNGLQDGSPMWGEGILSGLPYIHLASSAAACLMRVANLWCMLGWNGLAREADPH